MPAVSKSINKYPKKKTEHPEFKKGQVGYIICPVCHCAYYQKSWHHALAYNNHFNETKKLKFIICPADKMINAGQYEGQLILENIPSAVKYDLFHLIENIGARAFNRDPLDRVISIKENKNNIEILTTENQLAARIAKKIKESFKNKMKESWEIKHSHREDPVRIIWKQK